MTLGKILSGYCVEQWKDGMSFYYEANHLRDASVPPAWFNRYDTHGKKLCRWPDCDKYPQYPLRLYCGDEHQTKWNDWYYDNYTWDGVRESVFERDNKTCQRCGKKEWNNGLLECDHIKQVAVIEQYGYVYYNLKAFKEYLYNKDNLRTLCMPCHRIVTGEFLGTLKRGRIGVDEGHFEGIQGIVFERFRWFLVLNEGDGANTVMTQFIFNS